MIFLKRGADHLAVGWVTGKYSPKIPPKISGYSATFMVKGFFMLKPGEKAILIEDLPASSLTGDLPIQGDPSLGMGYASDFAPYKPRADFTAVGTAYPPKRPGAMGTGAKRAGAMGSFLATMRVGAMEKAIKVFGERCWMGEMGSRALQPGTLDSPGRPDDLTPVPINYANAWGGHEDPMNPLGCGKEGTLMPRLELPGNPIRERETYAAPAVFAPMAPDSPLRKSKGGTYDTEWVESHWPWLPEDYDYSCFNAAPENQWMEGYLRGDEELSFHNMHPTVPHYRTRLPGVRIRCFINRITNWRLDLHAEEALTAFEEVPMELDTLWADMDEEKLVLVWRGRTPVKSLKRRDLQSLFVLREPLDEPSWPLAHYHDLYLEEMAKRPEPFSARKPLDPAAFAKKHGIKSAAEIREEVQAKLKEAFTKASKEWDAGMQASTKHIDSLAAMVPAEAAQARAEMAKASAVGNPFANYLANPKSPSKSNPTATKDLVASAERGLTPLVEEAAKFFQHALDNPATPESAKLTIVAKQKEFSEGVAKIRSMTASMEKSFGELEAKMVAIFPPCREGEEFLKDGLPDLARIRREGMANARLAGFDFSGLDLSAVDFSGSLLNGALFVGCNLQNANFTKATMMETDLTDADLRRAIFDHVNLSTCNVAGTTWSNASLTMADLSFLKLSGADFSGATGEMTNFTGTELAGANFRESKFKRAIFTNALLEKADFSAASLQACSLIAARGAGIVMHGADVTKMGAGHGADLTNGSFLRIRGEGTSWGGADLTGADFQQAVLPKASFSEAKLEGAHFDRCDLRWSNFDDAFLQYAVMTHANMMESSFSHADLTGARLDHSNLYGSALRNAVLLRSIWDGANITKTRLDL